MTTETDTLYSSLGEAERYVKELEGRLASAIQNIDGIIEAAEDGQDQASTINRLKGLRGLLQLST